MYGSPEKVPFERIDMSLRDYSSELEKGFHMKVVWPRFTWQFLKISQHMQCTVISS